MTQRAEIMRDEQEKARERQRAAGGDHRKAVVEKIPQAVDGAGKSRDKVAALVGVGRRR